jgi:hypothetical protein
VAAAVVAAASIPLDRGGIGWLVAALAGTAALVLARAFQHPAGPPASAQHPASPVDSAQGQAGPLVASPDQRAEPAAPPHAAPERRVESVPSLAGAGIRRLGPARIGWSVATVVLLGVGTFRAAGWLFVLCVMTALVTGLFAATDPRTFRGMVHAGLIGPFAGLRAVPWMTRGLRRAGRSVGVRAVLTALVSVALLVVFGGLFASADAAFADIVGAVLPTVDVPTVIRWIFIYTVTLVALSAAAFLRAAPPHLSDSESGRRRVARLEWAVPVGLLVLLFALFVGVQATVLFGGARHVIETSGLTYADYARGGFWQLLAVTGLTLLVIAGAARWAPREQRTDRVLIRMLLGALALLALVVVASALHRMNLYALAFGLTRLRVLVWLCEAWLGLAFVLILGAGIRLRARWLPRVVVATGVAALIGLAAADPDLLIAEHNIARWKQGGQIDVGYLSTLSADAAPALDRLPGELRVCPLAQTREDLADPDGWRGWNLARDRARGLLTLHPVGAFTASCYRL